MKRAIDESPKIRPNYRKGYDNQHAACSRVDSIISDAIHFEKTHAEILTDLARMYRTDWYRSLPEWRKSYVRGYLDCSMGAYNSRLAGHLRTGLVYQGVMYRTFDGWRAKHPDLAGSELQDSNVAAWKSGKVHSALNAEYVGMTFQWDGGTL